MHHDLRRLQSALLGLTEDQRQVLSLKFFEGLSTSEVARHMGRDEDAIRSLQRHGLQALSAVLGASS